VAERTGLSHAAVLEGGWGPARAGVMSKSGLEPRSTDRVLLVSLKTSDFLKFLYKAVVFLLVEVITCYSINFQSTAFRTKLSLNKIVNF